MLICWLPFALALAWQAASVSSEEQQTFPSFLKYHAMDERSQEAKSIVGSEQRQSPPRYVPKFQTEFPHDSEYYNQNPDYLDRSQQTQDTFNNAKHHEDRRRYPERIPSPHRATPEETNAKEVHDEGFVHPINFNNFLNDIGAASGTSNTFFGTQAGSSNVFGGFNNFNNPQGNNPSPFGGFIGSGSTGNRQLFGDINSSNQPNAIPNFSQSEKHNNFKGFDFQFQPFPNQEKSVYLPVQDKKQESFSKKPIRENQNQREHRYNKQGPYQEEYRRPDEDRRYLNYDRDEEYNDSKLQQNHYAPDHGQFPQSGDPYHFDPPPYPDIGQVFSNRPNRPTAQKEIPQSSSQTKPTASVSASSNSKAPLSQEKMKCKQILKRMSDEEYNEYFEYEGRQSKKRPNPNKMLSCNVCEDEYGDYRESCSYSSKAQPSAEHVVYSDRRRYGPQESQLMLYDSDGLLIKSRQKRMSHHTPVSANPGPTLKDVLQGSTNTKTPVYHPTKSGSIFVTNPSKLEEFQFQPGMGTFGLSSDIYNDFDFYKPPYSHFQKKSESKQAPKGKPHYKDNKHDRHGYPDEDFYKNPYEDHPDFHEGESKSFGYQDDYTAYDGPSMEDAEESIAHFEPLFSKRDDDIRDSIVRDAANNRKEIHGLMDSFTKTDRKNCKKVNKNEMTCYLCPNENRAQCAYSSNSPNSHHMEYSEEQEYGTRG